MLWRSFICCILLAFDYVHGQATQYLTATIRDFTRSDPGFRQANGDKGAQYVSSTLDAYSKPIWQAGTHSVSASTFGPWFNTPLTRQEQLASYTIELTRIGTSSMYRFGGNTDFFPIDNQLYGNDADGHNGAFTMEIRLVYKHSTAATTFKFGSADDLLVFINNKLVNHALAGVHPYEEVQLNMQSVGATLGLAAGTEYPMIIFYAHRSDSHAPRLMLELAASARCDAWTSGAQVANLFPVTQSGFLILNGGATLPTANTIRLTSKGSTTMGSSVWNNLLQRVQTGFVTDFTFKVDKGASRAEGFAFVLQKSVFGTAARGGSSGNLGYNFANCLAIEFDMTSNTGYNDPNDNHIEVHTRYNLDNSASSDGKVTTVTEENLANKGIRMDNGQEHRAVIQYSPSATGTGSGTISVLIDGILVTRATVDDARIASMFGGVAYVGFTASTSANTADTDIIAWRFYATPPSAPQSTAEPHVQGTPFNVVTAANTQPTTRSLFVQSRDACGHSIGVGGGTLLAELKSGSSVIPSSTYSVDGNDGKYDVWFWRQTSGSHSLNIMLNGQSIQGSPFAITINPGPASAAKSTVTPPGSFVAGVEQVVEAFLKDEFGNDINYSNAPIVMRFATGTDILPRPQPRGSTYTFDVRSDVATQSTSLFTRLGGVDIVGSPKSGVVVTHGLGVASNTLLQGDVITKPAGELGELRVYPQDQFGNPVTSGDPNDITFSMASTQPCTHASAPSFRSTANPPHFYMTYQCEKTGSYSLDIKYKGTSIKDIATFAPLIVPAAVDAAKSEVVVAPPARFSAGATASFTLQARDTFGNLRNTANDANMNFVVTVTVNTQGLTVTCGNTAVSDARIENLLCVYDQNGRYTVSFTPTVAATHTLSASYDGSLLAGAGSRTLDIVPASIDATKTLLATPLSPGTAGVDNSFTISSRDFYGNARNGAENDDTSRVQDIAITIIGGGVVPVTIKSIARTGQTADYVVTWMATVAGTYKVTARVGGLEIKDSGASTTVLAAAVDRHRTALFGPGLGGGVEGATVQFSIQAKDAFDNDVLTAPAGKFSVELVRESAVIFTATVGAPTNGLYLVSYTVPVFQGTGEFTIRVTFDDATSVREVKAFSASSGATSYAVASGRALNQAVAGTIETITIQDKDLNGDDIDVPGNTFVVEITMGTSTITAASYVVGAPGKYEIQYMVPKIGSYSIRIFLGSTETEQSKQGLGELVVSPGNLHQDNCDVIVPKQAVAGQDVHVTVLLRDANLNQLDGPASQFVTLTLSVQPNAGVTSSNVINNGDGTFEIIFAATAAGEKTVAVSAAGKNLGPGNVNTIIIVAADPDPRTTEVLAAPPFVAGDQGTFKLKIKDAYDNPILLTPTFSISLEKNPNTAVVATNLGGGEFELHFTATRTSGHQDPELTFSVHAANVKVLDTAIDVFPAALDATLSHVRNLTALVMAGNPIEFTLIARDRFDNPLQQYAEIDIRVRHSSDGTMLVPYYVRQFGQLHVRYPTEKGVATKAQKYEFLFTFGASLDFHPENEPVVVDVVPHYAKADRTRGITTNMPQLALTSFSAGASTTLGIRLVDMYGNFLTKSGGVTVAAHFFNGAVACKDSVVDPLDMTKAVDHLFPSAHGNSVTDNQDGSYVITIGTRKAGSYAVAVTVEGTLIKACANSDLTFTVHPVAADPERSVLDGNYAGGTAGLVLTFNVELRDRYDNRVRTGGQTVKVGSAPVSPSGACQPDTNWLKLGEEAVTDNQDGTFTIKFSATEARVYDLVVTVDDVLVGTTGTCPSFKILPARVDSFTKDPEQGLVYAATPASLFIRSKDRFGNDIIDGSEQYTAQFRRQDGHFAITDYTFTAVSKRNGTTQRIDYLAWWHGDYNVTLSVAPTYDGMNTSSIKYNLRIDAPLCGGIDPSKPFRCPTGECVAAYSACPDYDANCAFKCTDDGSTCAATPTECPCVGGFRCSSGHCVSTAEDCPVLFNENICPPEFACPTGGCRNKAGECPSMRACPRGYVVCPDGFSCATSKAKCVTSTTTGNCPTGWHKCFDGSCAPSGELCPSMTTCNGSKWESPVVCPDGSCQKSADDCQAFVSCVPPATVMCPDGSCRLSQADCPSRVVCPDGYVLCENGHCRFSLDECEQTFECPPELTRCADGSCKPNPLHCPSVISCPANTFRCPDGSCVTEYVQCPLPNVCKAPRSFPCSDGSCALSWAQCPTPVTCPRDRPVRCPDNTCANTANECETFASACPPHMPVRCPFGECRAVFDDCPTRSACVDVTPIRCPDGRCVASGDECGDVAHLLVCGEGKVRCPGGECAPTPSDCPTHLTCPPDQARCWDGTCRESCPPVEHDSRCITGVTCPQAAQGLLCAASLDTCPTSFVCPEDRPVRCPDATCAPTLADCPPSTTIRAVKVACPAGGWADSPSRCGTTVTCPPNLPVKCWDETCRYTAADCPVPPACTAANPYLCSDGSCVNTVASCPNLNLCRDVNAPVKCFAYRSGGGCVHNNTMCDDVTDLTLTLSFPCPDGGRRCKDGSCATDSFYCREFTCPHFMFRCPDGMCAKRPQECNAANGCPWDEPFKCEDGRCVEDAGQCGDCPWYRPYECIDGSCAKDIESCFIKCDNSTKSERCPDGSCISAESQTCPQGNGCVANSERCHDKSCQPIVGGVSACTSKDDRANACPAARPYRCDDGLCAISSVFCPLFPGSVSRNKTCGVTEAAGSKYFLCADGSCRGSPFECPVVRPCPRNTLRCDDGSCRENGLCPEVNTCPEARPHRCENGFCVESSLQCPSDWTGCPFGTIKCENTGRCLMSHQCDAPENLLEGSGCDPGQYKCWDGECVAELSSCRLRNGCTREHPFLCSDGTCRNSTCTTPRGPVSCPGQVVCPNKQCAPSLAECKLENGCPADRPIRCARKGECKAMPAWPGMLHEDACSPVVTCDAAKPVLCADGTCVSHGKLCRPVYQCPSDEPYLCPDMRCAPDRASCGRALAVCPATAPALCPSGACKKSIRECESVTGAKCPAPWLRCADGTCQSGPQECVRRTFSIHHAGETFDVDADVSGNRTCPSAAREVCADGSCVLAPAQCAVVRPCPDAFPLRCADGTCVSNVTVCDPVAACSPGLTRCEDGLCRQACLPFAGCPLGRPYFCAGLRQPCVTNVAACNAALRPNHSPTRRRLAALAADNGKAESCVGNCEKYLPAIAQAVTVSAAATTTIDVSIDSAGVARTQLIVPAGAMGGDAMVTIKPVPWVDLDRGDFLFAQKVLSTPFACSVEGYSGNLLLNLTVNGAVDLQQYSSTSGSGERGDLDQLQVPCELINAYDTILTGTDVSCSGKFTLNEADMVATTDLCDNFVFSGPLLEARVVAAFDATQATAEHCLCFNATRTDLVPGVTSALQQNQKVCMNIFRSGDTVLVRLDNSSHYASCPAADDDAKEYRLSNVVAFGRCASGSADGVQLIPPQDICLGVLDARTNQWACVDDYYGRVSLPSWSDEAGRPRFRVVGRIASCEQYKAVAFVNIPLPPPPQAPVERKTWWEEYGVIVLATSASFIVVMAISSYVIWRLKRYRDKYKAEQKKQVELQERVRELDEYAGGLGIADEEVDMVANPLVVQMKELERQIERVNEDMAREGEEEKQIDELERERQRLFAEIERVKQDLEKQRQEQRAERVSVAMTPVVVPMGVAASTTASSAATTAAQPQRADFGAPTRPGGRRKKGTD